MEVVITAGGMQLLHQRDAFLRSKVHPGATFAAVDHRHLAQQHLASSGLASEKVAAGHHVVGVADVMRPTRRGLRLRRRGLGLRRRKARRRSGRRARWWRRRARWWRRWWRAVAAQCAKPEGVSRYHTRPVHKCPVACWLELANQFFGPLQPGCDGEDGHPGDGNAVDECETGPATAGRPHDREKHGHCGRAGVATPRSAATLLNFLLLGCNLKCGAGSSHRALKCEIV
eukprot:scaffold56284_cov66-Phaeocystis_antarctica.AAC.2